MPIYTQENTLRLAKRYRNAKRTYLLVNPLQAKHLPVRPGAALDMMDFEGIEKVRERVSQNGTLYQQLQQMAQQLQKMAAIIDQQNGTNVSAAASAAGQVIPTIMMQAANTAARIASVCRFIAFIASSFRYAHRCCRNSTGLHTCDCHMAFFKGCGRRTWVIHNRGVSSTFIHKTP